MTVLYGYIFTWDGFSQAGDDGFSDAFVGAVTKLKQFKNGGGRQPRASRWKRLIFESPQPLLGEEPGFVPSVWTYKVHLRVNDKTGTVIIAAQRYTITDAVVQVINFKVTPNIRRKVINVGEVSEHLLAPSPQQFAMTYYMADIPGYGSALSTISLHGDDIAAADFLVNERNNFTARQIGVRPLSQKAECGRFSNTGQIQFRDENLDTLERFLSYTYENGFYID